MQYEIKPLNEEEAEYVGARFYADGDSLSSFPEGEEERIVLKAVDGEGGFVGGCVLDVDCTKIAEFERLWVAEPYRRQGVGTALIRTAERMAAEKGCRTIVNAYTFDFQDALPLFERLGYRLLGVSKDWPKGHEGYTLVKRPEASFGDFPHPAFARASFEIVPGSEEDGEIIRDRLETFNRRFAPRSHPYLDLDRKLLDGDGRLIAGCIAGVSGWDTAHIDLLWIEPPFRGGDAGTVLLDAIEREARENGAYLARTEAPYGQTAFFLRHGYTVQVVYEDEPKWTVLQKRL